MRTQPKSIIRQTAQDYFDTSMLFKRDAITSLLILLSSLLLNTFIPFLIGKTLGALSRHGSTSTDVVLLIITSIIGVFANYFGFRAWVTLQPKVLSELEKSTLQALLNRSASFHNNRISGKLITDANAYSTAYLDLANSLYMVLAPFALSLVVGIIIITISSWILGLLVFIMTASILVVTFLQTRKLSVYRERRHDARRAMIAHSSDTIVNNQTVKTFAGESREMKMHGELNHKLSMLRTDDWQRITSAGSKRIAVLLAFEITFVMLTIKLVSDNPALLGIGIFSFSYALTLGNKLFDIGGTFQKIEDCFLEAGDMTKIIHETPEILNKPHAKKLAVTKGAIDLTAVTFSYSDNSNQQVFSNLNLQIKPGERIGLVGPSGGGKSTFTRLLLRFDDIQSGSISIDNQNIADVTQESLRQAVSYVPQEPLLFHRTIAENIAYGNPAATREQVIASAKEAYAHDFINQLPDGYDTIVGERGVKLSGGQRQRVAIARALLKNAPILVLDEATSALDSESEIYIQSALWELMKNRTALVIAHRLSTIQKLDRILVLVDGQIIEDGSHKELLKQKGTYAKLWAHQSGGFIEE